MRNPCIWTVVLAAFFSPQALAGGQPAGLVVGWGLDYAGGGVTYATGLVMIAGQPLTNAVAIAAGGGTFAGTDRGRRGGGLGSKRRR